MSGQENSPPEYGCKIPQDALDQMRESEDVDGYPIPDVPLFTGNPIITVRRKADVRFKKLNPRAQAPQRTYEHDAGFDLVATSMTESDQYIQYGVGLAFAIPPGYAMFLFPRSSVSKKNLCLVNCVGVIDSTYRGEVAARFRVTKEISRSDSSPGDPLYRVGDRVVQAIILELPQVEFNEVDELSDTARGTDGFGSSGS
ncbi:dUTP diphosphatase [Candidatus Pacearchaeota archaeon]|nr:dUTP diphosphatase [Candidatus Pacearchaeota archaeon]